MTSTPPVYIPVPAPVLFKCDMCTGDFANVSYYKCFTCHEAGLFWRHCESCDIARNNAIFWGEDPRHDQNHVFVKFPPNQRKK